MASSFLLARLTRLNLALQRRRARRGFAEILVSFLLQKRSFRELLVQETATNSCLPAEKKSPKSLFGFSILDVDSNRSARIFLVRVEWEERYVEQHESPRPQGLREPLFAGRGAHRFLSRRNRLGTDEREDFTSYAMLKLVENDYARLRKYRGDSSFRTYLTVVMQRLFLDYRTQKWGKWRPSTTATPRGDCGRAGNAPLPRWYRLPRGPRNASHPDRYSSQRGGSLGSRDRTPTPPTCQARRGGCSRKRRRPRA